VPADKQGQFGYGNVWTWVALEAETKLIPSWRVGTRGAATAYEFMHDLAWRPANRVQLTTNGHRVYLDAVESGESTSTRWAFSTCITTSAGFTKHCASHQRWKRELPTTFGT